MRPALAIVMLGGQSANSLGPAEGREARHRTGRRRGRSISAVVEGCHILDHPGGSLIFLLLRDRILDEIDAAA